METFVMSCPIRYTLPLTSAFTSILSLFFLSNTKTSLFRSATHLDATPSPNFFSPSQILKPSLTKKYLINSPTCLKKSFALSGFSTSLSYVQTGTSIFLSAVSSTLGASFSSPVSPYTSSVCPFPSIPAIQTISPACTVKETSLTASFL